MAELLVLFKDAQDSRGPWPHHQSFRRASLRSPSSKTGGAAKGIPVLLTTELLLFCSPRDTKIHKAAAKISKADKSVRAKADEFMGCRFGGE